jgi:hypothetical protein
MFKNTLFLYLTCHCHHQQYHRLKPSRFLQISGAQLAARPHPLLSSTISLRKETTLFSRPLLCITYLLGRRNFVSCASSDDETQSSVDKCARELWEAKGRKKKIAEQRRKACEMWLSAAKQGDVAAQYSVAILRLNGEAAEYGIPKDVKIALNILHSIAERHNHSMAMVSVYYRNSLEQ